MLRTFSTLVFLLFNQIIFGQAVKVSLIDDEEGWRNIRLGTPISEYNDLTVTLVAPHGIMYTRNNENLKFGKIKASEIEYFFINDTLATFSIWFKKAGDVHSFTKELKVRFGKPTKFIDGDPVWEGKAISVTPIPVFRMVIFASKSSYNEK